jgi:cysteine synthase
VAKITLVNQTSIPASQYGYRMAATNDNNFYISYGESIANFGAAYAITQESVKSQGTTIASMQGQLNAMTQYCMALQQQSTPTNHVAQHQRGTTNSWCGLA